MSAGPQQVSLDDLTLRDHDAAPSVLRLQDGGRVLLADAGTHARLAEVVSLPGTAGLAAIYVRREPQETVPEADANLGQV